MKFSIAVSTVVALLASSAIAAPAPQFGRPRKTITKVTVTTSTSTRFVDVTTPVTSSTSSVVVPQPSPITTSSAVPAPEPTSEAPVPTPEAPKPEPTSEAPQPEPTVEAPQPTSEAPKPEPTTEAPKPTSTSTPPPPPTTTTSEPVLAPAPTTGKAPAGESFADMMLRVHNAKRALHHAPPLVWDSALASGSSAHSAKCVFAHGSSGENLAYGGVDARLGETTDAQAQERLLNSWYNEVVDYDFNAGQFTSGTGHFTQMVWKSATKLGCGVAQCDGFMKNFVTCRYDKGNLIGAFKENVLPQ